MSKYGTLIMGCKIFNAQKSDTNLIWGNQICISLKKEVILFKLLTWMVIRVYFKKLIIKIIYNNKFNQIHLKKNYIFLLKNWIIDFYRIIIFI